METGSFGCTVEALCFTTQQSPAMKSDKIMAQDDIKKLLKQNVR